MVDRLCPDMFVQTGVPDSDGVICQTYVKVGVGDPVNVTAEVRTFPRRTLPLTPLLEGAVVALTCGATGIRTLKLVVAAFDEVPSPPSPPYSMMYALRLHVF